MAVNRTMPATATMTRVPRVGGGAIWAAVDPEGAISIGAGMRDRSGCDMFTPEMAAARCAGSDSPARDSRRRR